MQKDLIVILIKNIESVFTHALCLFQGKFKFFAAFFGSLTKCCCIYNTDRNGKYSFIIFGYYEIMKFICDLFFQCHSVFCGGSFQIHDHILIRYQMVNSLLVRKAFLHTSGYAFQDIITIISSPGAIDRSKIINSYMHQKSLGNGFFLCTQVSKEFRPAKQSCDIIGSSLVAGLIQTPDQIHCLSLLIIDHDTTAVDPDRPTFFIEPPVMKIMYLFSSFAYIREMLCKHLTVFLIHYLHNFICSICQNIFRHIKPFHS